MHFVENFPLPSWCFCDASQSGLRAETGEAELWVSRHLFLSMGKEKSSKRKRSEPKIVSEDELDPEVESTPKRAKSSEGVHKVKDGLPMESAPVDARDEATDGVLTQREFSELELSKQTADALRDMGFSRMTEVQARSIPHAMAGRDVLGAARTGSGKTLAFLIPVVELLVRVKWMNRNGTAAVVLAPTRELALQIYGVASELCKYHSQSFGIVMGGANRKMEADKLQRGVAILVATPGRLLDHLQNTPGFLYSNLQVFVVDEADRCLEIGFISLHIL